MEVDVRDVGEVRLEVKAEDRNYHVRDDGVILACVRRTREREMIKIRYHLRWVESTSPFRRLWEIMLANQSMQVTMRRCERGEDVDV